MLSRDFLFLEKRREMRLIIMIWSIRKLHTLPVYNILNNIFTHNIKTLDCPNALNSDYSLLYHWLLALK
ncbi:MAG: hypothetical protein UV09_C0009G0012 [Candidatus Gottesmanbacteria bacterium GW2011_GWA2_42_18]|uniref:Uncharacterized protein n=1 Tax=Candidatus Gottesmanbacteria bacterium GW2011_GWA2_42_18 TaxID=1618442 RepID=A0A0G1CBP5_9BACT|nr:MAG: hypothetical protein UV09_C0009G0012 [Candidatus Gottesmanbacteria bacterium GW2011_GWA2_42_18]KKS76052.1 MAG: hypothetical protein UV46_C0009G0012 [Candidatus Gottesmanbacteria bacterium GW2011_GWC2_42_8]